ncbi:PTS system IIB component (L-Asc family) [Gibbsiella quercinecans]|uniref:PTS lactose transporter subunit IIB n=1 Tax=Gibbsiella quercinecans TaxID=929813 RepID=A0A250B077_9GAMM|nr:PTS sugar transporter subunit IIB [Gibbsiella quercinecans]ATA19564.1 PTS lactose transporter subunit IIB [Gibbsiella quercinecans]RLM06516.1 PTS lactose transporter subunit IIB [Gibbsiella quercinecans]RLM11246.1 PTS lactose transporter subunit IIB [Gibbsiella quercinecans]TCT83312.1 PTS system IIB component (L-Asc family) [Gibbsiella quercinecans]
MLKVLCVCGCGLGSSFAIEMSAKSVLQKLGIDAEINHTTVSEATSFKYDIILTQKMFADILNSDASEEQMKKVIVLNKLTDKREIEEKILAYINSI